MLAPGKNCVCSSCFARSYEHYDSHYLVGRKKASIDLGHPYPEDLDRLLAMKRKNLERLTKWKDKSPKRVSRQTKRNKETEEEIEVVNAIPCSEVYLENPTSVDGRLPIANLNPGNFWDFVYRNKWKGRIRVCEGELMYRITETFKKLAKEKMIGNFNITRLFTAAGSRDDGFGKVGVSICAANGSSIFGISNEADSIRTP